MTFVHDLATAHDMDPAECKRILGGKGASLVAMHRLGLPVPPAIVITTDACRYFLEHGQLPDGLMEEVGVGLKAIERELDRRLDDPVTPLLLSVRSGAPVSMPGMMDTVLNLGITHATVPGIEAMFGDGHFARDAARRFIESYGSVVLGVDADVFARTATKVRAGRETDEAVLDEMMAAFRELVHDESGSRVPDTGREQLQQAIEAVFRSWENPRAKTYRELEELSDDLGTAVTIQAMVFGNLDDRSGTGVAFTRNPNTGEPELYGDFLFTAQGEDVVSGRHDTLPLSDLSGALPEVWEQLVETCSILEAELQDMCDLEFTVEGGRFWMLQVRRGKRAAVAAVRIAVDLAEEGRITREDAICSLTKKHLSRLDRPYLDPTADYIVLTTGLNASPGVATGRIVLSADEVLTQDTDEPVILVRPETSPSDVHGMALAAGILTSKGGLVSHAAVVARDMGTPAVVGASDVEIDAAARQVRIRDAVLQAGDLLTIDGTTGEVVSGGVRCVDPVQSEHLATLLEWADAIAGDRAVPDGSPVDRLTAAHQALEATAPQPA